MIQIIAQYWCSKTSKKKKRRKKNCLTSKFAVDNILEKVKEIVMGPLLHFTTCNLHDVKSILCILNIVKTYLVYMEIVVFCYVTVILSTLQVTS